MDGGDKKGNSERILSGAPKMKIRKFKIILLILVVILLAKIIVTLFALPKATIDYVAQYNEITKPIDFTPENNAADYYLKAAGLYKEQPRELFNSEVIYKWEDGRLTIDELPSETINQLEDWVESNKPAFEQVKLALQKPYFWFKKESDNGSTMNITYIEISSMKNIAEALLYSAKLKVSKKDFISAADDIIESYRIGQHLCRDNFSRIEQYAGISTKNEATKTMMGILTHSNPKLEQLEYFQDLFQNTIDNDKYIPSTSTEKVFQYDVIQRIYLNWVWGINKPSFRVLHGIVCLCGDNNFLWVQAFVGPSQSKVIYQIDRIFDLYEQLRDKTPWQIQHQYIEQLDEIKAINESNFFMEMFGCPFGRLFFVSQETKTQTEALITVLAILRFKADNNRLPETLDELVSVGYIKKLPQDPYSENILVYKLVDEDFKLYSVGGDFEDNNGEPVMIESNVGCGFNRMDIPGMPFSPSSGTIKRPFLKDIIYWPEMKKPVGYQQIGF